MTVLHSHISIIFCIHLFFFSSHLNREKKSDEDHPQPATSNAKTELNEKVENTALNKDATDNETPSKKEETKHNKEETNQTHQRGGRTGRSKKCYICKQLYSMPKKKKRDVIWETYIRMCRKCGEVNYEKRHQRADLTDKYAVVTGGRIKIGEDGKLSVTK